MLSFQLDSFSFGGTGSNARRMRAIAEGLLRTTDLMLPIVIYIGHAFLSPERFVKCVVSEGQMTGIKVDPRGSVS